MVCGLLPPARRGADGPGCARTRTKPKLAHNNNQREFLALDVREKLQRKEPFLPEDGARSIPYIVCWEVRKVVYLKYVTPGPSKLENVADPCSGPRGPKIGVLYLNLNGAV